MTRGDERPGRVLIVEWNYDDMASLAGLIHRTAPEVEIHKTGNGGTALKLLTSKTFDAFFIRLDACDSEGAWLAAAIRELSACRTVPLLFVAGEGIDRLDLFRTYHCYDVLDRPLQESAFGAAAGPLLEILRGKRDAEAPSGDRDRRFVVVNTQGRHILSVGDLLYAETDRHNLILHTRQQVLDGVRMRLSDLVSWVGDGGFLRCHRSYAVNLAYVTGVRTLHSRLRSLALGQPGLECPCSRPYFDAVERALGRMAEEVGSDGKAGTIFPTGGTKRTLEEE